MTMGMATEKQGTGEIWKRRKKANEESTRSNTSERSLWETEASTTTIWIWNSPPDQDRPQTTSFGDGAILAVRNGDVTFRLKSNTANDKIMIQDADNEFGLWGSIVFENYASMVSNVAEEVKTDETDLTTISFEVTRHAFYMSRSGAARRALIFIIDYKANYIQTYATTTPFGTPGHGYRRGGRG